MKRLCLTFLTLLLLLTAFPFASVAEEIVISSAVDEVSGELVIGWDPLSIPEGYALSGVRDADLNFYTPTASADDTASFAVPFTGDGDYSFDAIFSMELGESLYIPFTLTITTATEPTEPTEPQEPTVPIEIVDIVWDDAYQHLSITWVPRKDLMIDSIEVNGQKVFLLDSSGSIRKVTLKDLPYGRFFVTYNCTDGEDTFSYTDEEHSFVVYGGEISTKLYVSSDENGAPLVQVYDAKSTPISGVMVHLITKTGEQVLATDESGKVVFDGEYKDVKRVYSEDLQTEFALFKGQTVEVEQTTATTAPPTTKAPTSKPPKTTKPAPSTSASATQPTTTQTYYAGAGTTGVEENMVVLNAILGEGVMETFGLTGSEFDTGARLLVSREIYDSLMTRGNGLPIMLSIFLDNRVLENADILNVLSQQQEKYDSSTILSYVIELGLVFWDAENQTAIPIKDLPYDSYVVRLPRPQKAEEHNRFYVLDMSGDAVGEYVEAIAEPEYVQVTLTNVNAIALVACEVPFAQSSWHVHPLVYVFIILGSLLLLLGAAMIYLFFIYRPKATAGPVEQANVDLDSEAEDNAIVDVADEMVLDDETSFEDMLETDELGDDIPEDEIEESISLGDLFNRNDS